MLCAQAWLEHHSTSPLSNLPLEHKALEADLGMRRRVRWWLEALLEDRDQRAATRWRSELEGSPSGGGGGVAVHGGRGGRGGRGPTELAGGRTGAGRGGGGRGLGVRAVAFAADSR